MESYELGKLAEAFKEERFKQGEFVIKEGDAGNVFYLILEGEAVATKIISSLPTEVKHYKAGDYFGEISLLKNVPRGASVKALSQEGLKVVSLDRACFKRLLGPLDDILKRNMDTYLSHVMK